MVITLLFDGGSIWWESPISPSADCEVRKSYLQSTYGCGVRRSSGTKSQRHWPHDGRTRPPYTRSSSASEDYSHAPAVTTTTSANLIMLSFDALWLGYYQALGLHHKWCKSKMSDIQLHDNNDNGILSDQ